MFSLWTTLIEGKAYMQFLKNETVMEIKASWHQFIKRKKKEFPLYLRTPKPHLLPLGTGVTIPTAIVFYSHGKHVLLALRLSII